MSQKFILSQLNPRSSFDNSAVEITIIEPHTRCLPSISPISCSKHHQHHHHHKKSEHKKWEVREDLQKKMKEVKQKISELESQSVCQSSNVSKTKYDYFKRNNVTGNASGTSKTLTRSISEGELQQSRKKRHDYQKVYSSQKSIFCQVCDLRLLRQDEILRFVFTQNQQLLNIMQEIKAELQEMKNEKKLEKKCKRRGKSLTVLSSASVVNESLPTMCQQQQDTEGTVQEEHVSKDFYTGEQLENKLPTVKAKQMQKDSRRKENVVCVDRIRDSSQKILMKQNGNSDQHIMNSNINSISSTKHSIEVSSHVANVKYNVPQSSILEDTGTLVGQGKLDSKSFIPNITDKFKDFPQKETLVPLNRLSTTKQADKNTNVQQKTLTSISSSSKNYGYKDDTMPKDNHHRQIKPLKLLRARQTQLQGKDGVSNPIAIKEDWKISGNKVNIPAISYNSKVNNTEDEFRNSLGRLIDKSDCSPTSQTCSKPSFDINFISKIDLNGKKEAQYRPQHSSTSTEFENAELASKNKDQKHKLGKLLKIKKSALFGSSSTDSSSKPPTLARDSQSSLTFVIKNSKLKTAGINQENGDILQFPETVAPKSDIACQYNTTDPIKAPELDVYNSQYVHTTSYATSPLLFGGKSNMHMVPDTAAVHDVEAMSTGKRLGRILTKKSISYNKVSSGQKYNSSDNMSSPSIFCNKEEQKDNYTFAEMASMNQTSHLEHLSKHSLIFWDGENFIVDEEALPQMDCPTSTHIDQDTKESLRKMSEVEDSENLEGRIAAVEKDSVWKQHTPETEISENTRNYMQQSYMNPNFNFIPASEASITPWCMDQGSQEKQGSNTTNKSEPGGCEGVMQEIELTLSFDDLEFLLLHKIKKQEEKNDIAQVESLRKALDVVRQYFKAQKKFLQDNFEVLPSPKETVSRIKTIIISPRDFPGGQHVRLSTVPDK